MGHAYEHAPNPICLLIAFTHCIETTPQQVYWRCSHQISGLNAQNCRTWVGSNERGLSAHIQITASETARQPQKRDLYLT